MTKTYKIGNRKLEIETVPNKKEIYYHDLCEVVYFLLEALSDKEETVVDPTLLGKAKWTISEGDTVYSYDLDKEESKEEEVKGWVRKDENGNWVNCHMMDAKALLSHDGRVIKRKQEDYPLPEDFTKQSISLIKQIDDLTKWVHSDETIKEILKLVQSHLVKQIEEWWEKEIICDGSITVTKELRKSKQDIIKIINIIK